VSVPRSSQRVGVGECARFHKGLQPGKWGRRNARHALHTSATRTHPETHTQANIRRQMTMEAMTPVKSAISPAGTACRVRRTLTEPK